MALISVTKRQERILYVLTFVLVFLSFFFIKEYLMLVAIAGIMAVLFNPVYGWFLKKGRSQGAASFYTFMISILVVIIPVALIGAMTFFQIQHFANTISAGDYSINLSNLAGTVIDDINAFFANVGIDYQVSTGQLANNFADAISAFSTALFSTIVSTFTGFFGLITSAIIYIYVFLSMLKNRDTIMLTIKRLNPLGDEISDIYFGRITSMIKATIRGQFIIAFMQGLASAAVLAIVGFNDLFFFFLIFLTLMSVIPLGAGIITIPIGILMIIFGDIWQGVAVILNHLLIVTNIDNIMRPKLVPKDARLDSALMILAVFSGLALFGFFGIVIGPVIMIIVVTTLQIYTEVFYDDESIERSKTEKVKGKLKKLAGKLGLGRRPHDLS